ncbi:MAG: 1-deoxy-D-xylulose-5-phosphate synthase, partial [Planctomycetes bacterium]|nr:1-deoxy-D-xylulose-5-phosphate synthase [Planctomycetota bacterium]
AYLRGLPGMVLMAPVDEAELREALAFSLEQRQPCAIRYPRANVPEAIIPCPPFNTGRARKLRDGDDASVLAYGVSTTDALTAADVLAESGIEVAVYAARFASPIDAGMVKTVFAAGSPVVTVEDHSIAGGFGSAVLERAQELGLASERLLRLGMPADRFIAHGSRASQMAECGIDASGIAAAIQRLVEERDALDGQIIRLAARSVASH